MRIGIDAHIILPQHKRYDPAIARYTEELIRDVVEGDAKGEHTWVLFFDARMQGSERMKQFEKQFEKKFGKKWRERVVIKHFPFVQYRRYLPVVYSHMLISSFLTAARLHVFHSPEGLIPYLYPGKIVTTFHYVPRGESESNLFVRTFMLGARAAFAQLCKRASRIIVTEASDKKLLVEKHGYAGERVMLMPAVSVKGLMKVYEEVGGGSKGLKSRKTTPRGEAKTSK